MSLTDCLAVIGPWQRIFVLVTAACGIVFFIVAMWRIDRGQTEFRIADLVLEGSPPKASLNKLTLLVFAGLAVWVIVLAVLENRIAPDVVNLILGVLGIFVLGRVGNQAVDRFSARRAATTVDVQTANVTVNDPDDEPERPIARPKPRASLLK